MSINETYDDYVRGSVRLTNRGKVVLLVVAAVFIWNVAGIQVL